MIWGTSNSRLFWEEETGPWDIEMKSFFSVDKWINEPDDFKTCFLFFSWGSTFGSETFRYFSKSFFKNSCFFWQFAIILTAPRCEQSVMSHCSQWSSKYWLRWSGHSGVANKCFWDTYSMNFGLICDMFLYTIFTQVNMTNLTVYGDQCCFTRCTVHNILDTILVGHIHELILLK